MIESAKQALAFATGKEDHGCEVHVPDNIDVKAIRERISLSQGEFAKLFGLSKRTLEHWEHGRRVPSGPARAFLKRYGATYPVVFDPSGETVGPYGVGQGTPQTFFVDRRGRLIPPHVLGPVTAASLAAGISRALKA